MNLTNPLITVGMPVYNGEKYISEAVESILNQTFDDFELIISDNLSTDGTGEICRDYAKKDPRVIYIRQEKNIGAPRNWNFVFGRRRGVYFKWASANDFCHPEMLNRCKEVLDLNADVVLCYPRTNLVDEDGIVISEYEDVLNLQNPHASDRFESLLTKIELNNAQNGLIRSEVLGRTALEGAYQSGDITLMAELSLHGKFYEIPEVLFFRRMAPGAVTSLRSNLEKRRFNNPDSAGWFYFPLLQFYLGLFLAVSRSPINQRERLRLYYFLSKMLYWNKREILREFRCP